nr:hypothetical protein CFP56_71325 [Quercus suber]
MSPICGLSRAKWTECPALTCGWRFPVGDHIIADTPRMPFRTLTLHVLQLDSTAEIARSIAFSVKGVISRIRNVINSLKLSGLNKQTKRNSRSDGISIMSSADVAKNMRSGTEALVMAFDGTWTLDAAMAPRAPECLHIIIPSSMKLDPKTNDEWASSFKNVEKIVCRSSFDGETPVGAFHNDYVWILTFDKNGEKIVKIEEFYDTNAATGMMERIKAAGLNEKHQLAVGNVFDSHALHATLDSTAEIARSIAFSVKGVISRIRNVINSLKLSGLNKQTKRNSRSDGISIMSSADVAKNMRSGTEALVMAFDGTWTLDAAMAPRAPECLHIIIPSSMKLDPKTNDEWASSFKNVEKIVCRSSFDGETPVGAFHNDYVWILTFDKNGEKIVKIEEFYDTNAATGMMERIKAAGLNEKHQLAVGNVFDSHALHATVSFPDVLTSYGAQFHCSLAEGVFCRIASQPRPGK